MASIKCAHCKQTPSSVQDVRDCAAGSGVRTQEATKEQVAATAKVTNWVADRAKRLHDQQIAVHAPKSTAGSGDPKGTFAAPKPTAVERIRTAAACLPDVETAYYAIQEIDFSKDSELVWKFYRVDRPQKGKWKGYTFLKVQSSDEFWKVSSLTRVASVLEAIAFNVEKALAEYGHQKGRCGICNRTLTDPESIARGIGPVCADRL